VDILILIIFGFVLMWVFVLLPQRRRMATHERLVEGLEVGDEVLTAGGLFGDVTEIGDDEVALEIAPGVVVRVAARAIASIVPPGTYVDDEEDEADQPAGPADATARAAGDASGAAADRRPEEPVAEPPASAEPGRR
jgi:preprotein translocase subunit YajC